tara:strand:+ start:1361 stop:2770 length:1410 start_codon:yes stop_codon:yes gene_type:complete
MKITSKKEINLKRIPLKNNPDDFANAASPISKDKPDIGYMLDEVIKKKGEFFCSQPFIHMYIPTYGFAHPCCNTTMNVKKHIAEIGIEGVWNQPELRGLRDEMANGHKDRERTIKTCYRCIETEYLGFSTPRMAYNNDMKNDHEELAELDRLVKFVRENPASEYPVPDKIHTSQIKVWGNYCNLKCLMCSAEDSSSVAEEWIALGEFTPQEIIERSEKRSGSTVPFNPPLIRYEDNDIDEEEFWRTIKKTKRIQLIGGETFLIKQYIQILEKCVKEGWAKDKKLFIFSNNYGYPKMEYIRDLLAQFQKVHYKCSMELWGTKNDYIRYPSKWPEVEKNIRMMHAIPNTNIGFAMTLNPISIGYVDEAMEAGKEFGITPSYFNVTRPAWFTLKSLPDDVRDFYLDRLYSNSYDMIEKCTKAIDYLEKREFDEMKYHSMIAHIKRRDKLRKDNILNYFPEWKNHFKDDDYYG